MHLQIFISALVKQALKNDELNSAAAGMPFVTWAREFRTIKLGLPRRSGKTTALVDLYNSKPSLFFTHSKIEATSLSKEYGIDAMTPYDIRHDNWRISPETPIEFVLMDELLYFPGREEIEMRVYDYLQWLNTKKKLSSNFMIIGVGT